MSLQDNIAELLEKFSFNPSCFVQTPSRAGASEQKRAEAYPVSPVKQGEMAPHFPGAEGEPSQAESSPCYSLAAGW